MIRPQPASRIIGTATAAVWKADESMMAMIASHFSVGKSSIAETCWMPALLKRTSQRPAFSISARASSPFERSALM